MAITSTQTRVNLGTLDMSNQVIRVDFALDAAGGKEHTFTKPFKSTPEIIGMVLKEATGVGTMAVAAISLSALSVLTVGASITAGDIASVIVKGEI